MSSHSNQPSLNISWHPSITTATATPDRKAYHNFTFRSVIHGNKNPIGASIKQFKTFCSSSNLSSRTIPVYHDQNGINLTIRPCIGVLVNVVAPKIMPRNKAKIHAAIACDPCNLFCLTLYVKPIANTTNKTTNIAICLMLQLWNCAPAISNISTTLPP